MRIAMLLHKSVEFDSRVRREASALAAAGHSVVVLELAPVAERGRKLDGFERRSVLPPGWVRQRLPSLVYRPLMLIWFVRGVLAIRPDVVHAHDAAMLLPGVIGARLTGARLVYDSHELASSVPYRERGWAWFVTAIERLVVPRATAVITVSDGIAAGLLERYRLRSPPSVVRNVSALELTGPGGLRDALGVDESVPLVLHQGAAAPDRGCEVLVEAVSRLDGVHLVFLGDPEPSYAGQLRALIDARGLSDRASLLPNVPLRDLLAYTAEADVGVTLLQDNCENHRLALPNKLFEYIAAGVPVVVSALPEVERLVERYGVGWCVLPDSPDAVATAIGRALQSRDDPDLRRRLDRAANELRWPQEKTRLLDLYRRLETAPFRGPLLLLVRNTVSHDARVLRAARTAVRELGIEAVIVGVASGGTSRSEVADGGVKIVRVVSPRRPRRLAGGRRSGVHLEPPGGGAQAVAALDSRGRLRRIAAGGAFILQAIGVARRLRPSVVHANDWNTMWAGVAIKSLLGSALIYDSHELWTERNGRWESRAWLSACERLFVRVADEVITTSPGHADFLASRYRIKRPLVVRNVPEWRSTDDRPVRHPPVVVYIGGLMPGRGLEQMIDALPEVPEVRLRTVGPGSDRYRAQLIARAQELGVADRVEVAAAVAPERIKEELAGAAVGLCLIQPICRSYELSLPNKLLEYAAAGVPILASDLPVIAQVVSENNLGVIVEPDHPASIAEGIRRLLDEDVRRRIVASARAFTEANTWKRESSVLTERYVDVLPRSA